MPTHSAHACLPSCFCSPSHDQIEIWKAFSWSQQQSQKTLYTLGCPRLTCSWKIRSLTRRLGRQDAMYGILLHMCWVPANVSWCYVQILEHLVKHRLETTSGLEESTGEQLNFTTLATQTEGYLPTDLNDLVSRAIHEAVIRAGKENTTRPASVSLLNLSILDYAHWMLYEGCASASRFREGANWLHSSFITERQTTKVWCIMERRRRFVEFVECTFTGNLPLISYEGLRETKKVLRETLEWPTKYAAIFAKCPLRLRSGWVP